MKTMDVMTKSDLMKPSTDGGYSLTAHYIRTHWREMGGYGKPLLFDRELVELHLREKMWGPIKEAEEKRQRAQDLEQFVRGKVVELQYAAKGTVGTVGQIARKGGRRIRAVGA